MSKGLEAYSVSYKAMLAQMAFTLGFEDAIAGKWRRSGGAVAAELCLGNHRNIHRIKFRQCYGAGYDMAKLEMTIKGKD